MFLTQEDDGRWYVAAADLAEMLRIPTGQLQRLAREGAIPRPIGAGRGCRYDLVAAVSGFVSDLKGIRTRPHAGADQATEPVGEDE